MVREWSKAHAMEKLRLATTDAQIDAAIRPVLALINEHPDYYTTSSCAGRIQLIQIPNIGEKQAARVLGKWHYIISADHVKSAIDGTGQGWIFLLSEPPILHIVCRTLENAVSILNSGRKAGFKHSGIRSIKLREGSVCKLVVELMSTERVDALIGTNAILIDDPILEAVIQCANIAWSRGSIKLKRLEHELRSQLGVADPGI